MARTPTRASSSSKPRRARRPARVDRGSVLMAVGELLRQQVDLDTILAQVIDAVTEAMRADRGTFYLVDRARDQIFSKAGHYPEIGEIRLQIGQGVAGYVARTGQSVNLEDPVADPRFLGDIDDRTGYATRHILCAPVKDRAGELLGVIQLLNKRASSDARAPAGFDEDDEALLRALASQVAMVVESTSLYAQMRAPTRHPLDYRFNGIVGQSPAMRRVYDMVSKAAETDATVLVTGETGTGKGLLARAIHFNGPRRAGPFVAVDCAALPASLIENELFGHERGAFTGADRRYVGKFEAADGGTVFLDEIGEVPLGLQGKLLRVIQERAFERVGGSRTVTVDVRIIAATHRDLENMVARQQFREDLYYRLRVIALQMPPLRARGRADLEQLVYHFLGLYAARHGKSARALTPAALDRLAAHAWPGNIRELENCIEGAVVLSDRSALDEDDLPLVAARGREASPTPGPATTRAALAELSWDEMEKLYIEAVVAAHGGNRSASARAMGIGRTTLLRKIKQLGIDA
ncbi:MAG: sigma 54-interacting transcriptional regulator [Myxococcales bacterium]|nr:sigma 54-interacting transcriptional regulator [Myxococcales bacterium]